MAKRKAQSSKLKAKKKTTPKTSKKKTEDTEKTKKSSKKVESQTLAKPSRDESQTLAKPSRVEPRTMEELLAQTGFQLRGLKRGQKVEGVITDISKRTVLINIGAKTEGLMVNKEYEEVKDFLTKLKVGDKITTQVVSPENEKGQILLSIKEAAFGYQWDLFEQYQKTDEVVEIRGLEVNKGGLIARLRGVRGFVPASQLSSQYLGSLQQLQNKLFKAKVIEVDRDKNRLIFSEKQVSEAALLAQKQKALKNVKVGEVFEGVVSGVMPFGIFVRVSVDKGKKAKSTASAKKADTADKEELFLEGLVHISEISWEKVEDLAKMFKAGDKLKVKVLDIDETSSKLNLSIKQLSQDPWQKIADKYPADKKVYGKVTRLVAFGAFIELEAGVEGLIHISKIPADYDIKVGKKVEVYVESVDPEKRRMSLGLVLKEKPVGYK